jgi:hypothetical protein
MIDIQIGRSYICQPVGTTNAVTGVIEKIYMNTALVKVTNCELEDQSFVSECNQRMIVKFGDITNLSVA